MKREDINPQLFDETDYTGLKTDEDHQRKDADEIKALRNSPMLPSRPKKPGATFDGSGRVPIEEN
jgi:hypothetical protein